jgi:serine/threonine-protein kinase
MNPSVTMIDIRSLIRRPWFLRALISVAVFIAFILEFYPFRAIDNIAYDYFSTFRQSDEPSDIVIVAVDDRSVKEMGSLTPPRALLANSIIHLSRSGAKVIAVTEMYESRELNPGLTAIRSIQEDMKQAREEMDKPAKKTTKKKATARAKARARDEKTARKTAKGVYTAFEKSLKQAEAQADSDALLLLSLRTAARIIFPIRFSMDGPLSEDPDTFKLLERHKAPLEIRRGPLTDLKALKNPMHALLNPVPTARSVSYPFEGLASKSRTLGHINLFPDCGGILRKDALLIAYGTDGLYPSFALQSALRYKDKSLKDLTGMPRKGSGLVFDDLRIPVDSDLSMNISFRSGSPGSSDSPGGFPVYPFTDVAAGIVNSAEFRDKLVLVGDMTSLSLRYETPSGDSLTGTEVLASAVDTILSENHVYHPAWAFALEAILFIYFGIFITLILPRVSYRVGGLVTVLSVIPVLIFAVTLFLSAGYWLMVLSPMLLMVLWHATRLAGNYVSLGDKSRAHIESIEANRLLGISYQSRGELDHALERFMKCPVKDPAIKELLYGLAMDFERKRMPNKARPIYEHIHSTGRFKDVEDKLDLFKSPTMGTYISGAGSSDSTITSKVALPTLGRYEIIRELGQGAMGTVYLGKDPKINREVAIKTLHYAGVEDDQLEEVKRRFLQEAEAAGKLSHPNIMTIYDAGEEHDLAYLTMEVLDGRDLKEYCTTETLLPMEEAMRVVASVAEALDYAHKKGIVHRDIKPTNIMLLKDATVKVTDFGIARIIESSRTQTGTVMGTPSYMSPEQVAGQKLEGTSDIFSLGATFYELLSGERPFTGDSLATIMFNITNGNFTPIKKACPEIPPCGTKIINRMLSVDVDKRYQSGSELAADINKCIKNLTD